VNVWVRRHVSPDVNVREPIIRILYPILDTAKGAITIAQPDSKVVGIIASSFFIKNFLENILPIGEKGLVVVFQNTCNQTFTYEVNGHEADWLGFGDQHDTQFDHLTDTRDLEEIGFYTTSEGLYGGLPIDVEFCHYSVSTYPSMKMKNTHHTNFPIYYTFIAVSIFIFTAMFFICYDKLVSVRQQKVMKTAIQSTTIVSSLFPSNVRDRLLDVNGDGNNADHARGSIFQPTKSRLRTFLNDGERTNDSNRPIADLFTDTTVMFADIAGFTAWSSVREPTQVFTLLETVYGAFDIIANKRGVFKVETIGDSYVAVTGLPDPRKDHAVAMVKFARDCRGQFNELCSALENTLGPETGDLHLRIGLNSGPVTAGVLRGQKSRFQLFGDTVNTAARMESTGKVNKIQVSQTTADLLKKAKKSHWLQTRDEMVDAKGKGLMITYWVEPKSVASSTVSTADLTTENTKGNLCLQDDMPIGPRVSSQLERLVNWNIDVLERLLKKVVARRIALKRKVNRFNWNKTNSESMIVLDEVQEVIKLPEYDSKYSDFSPDSIVLEQRVRIQLREFVTTIALTYHNNPFHNFPHASHVGMSVAKLLSRIVAPDIDLKGYEQLHDHTYGITSDPLTQFACVFSALIHDADHPGVPNSQLVYEGTEMSETYKGKSIAEQNSINLAWSILLQDKYTELRKTICKSQAEATRFRQLVVNAVCATDIIDKDLKAARNKRWEKAFSVTGSSHFECKGQEQINRKATIVIEHIMQASDVAHTMQHWHIYIKWNERLYAEMYKAYMEGRSDKDPTSTWYKGEIGFFDFYVIPLAQKLSECGVFGVSSDEYLNYAIMNRLEWEKKGRDIVASYVEKYNRDKVLDKLDESLVAHVEQP
jgi:class 3 adenylate cyclase